MVKFRGAGSSSVGMGRWISVVLLAINVRACISILISKGGMGKGYFKLFLRFQVKLSSITNCDYLCVTMGMVCMP